MPISIAQSTLPPKLEKLRVPVKLNSSEQARLDSLFADQICVLRLITREGLSDCSKSAASHFLLRHRAELAPYIKSDRAEHVDQLTVLVQLLSTQSPAALLLDVTGLPSVAGKMLSVPLKGWGPLQLCHSEGATAMAEKYHLIQGFRLLHYGNRLEVELQWWPRTPGLGIVTNPPGKVVGRTVRIISPSSKVEPLQKRLVASAARKPQPPRQQMTHAITTTTAPALPSTAAPPPRPWTTSLSKKQRKRLRQQGINPYPPNVTTVHGSTHGIPLPIASGRRLPPHNFPSPSDTVAMSNISCSCNGENSNCFRCDGRGYYERSASTGLAAASPARPAPLRKAIVRYEHDARGDAYAIRENGRFLSNAMHDAFDDESVP